MEPGAPHAAVLRDLGRTRHRAGVGDVEQQRYHARVVGDDRLRVAGGGMDLRDAAVEELTDELPADAVVGTGHEDGLVAS
jgi:hypothetical protein